MDTRYKLHNAIIKHQATAGFLQANFPYNYLELDNAKGLRPLQLAAREGLLPVVLKLLAAAAEVNFGAVRYNTNTSLPLYFAVLNGHMLVAEIILIFGGDKVLALAQAVNHPDAHERLLNLQITQTTVLAVLFWLIKETDNVAIFSKVLKKLAESTSPDVLRRLLEFAVFNERKAIAEKILAFNPAVEMLSDPSHMCAGFWAVTKAVDMELATLCHNDAEKLLLLAQLAAKNAKHFNKIHREFSALKKQYIDYIPAQPVFFDLSRRQQKIYLAACAHETPENIKQFFSDENNPDTDYYTVVAYAFQINNFIALNALLPLVDNTVLLNYFLTDDNSQLCQFLLLNCNIDMYQFALEIAEKPALNTFIALGWSMQGIVSTLASRCVQQNIIPSVAEVRLFKANLDISINLLAESLQDRYNLEFAKPLSIENKPYFISIEDELDKLELLLIARHYLRLGIHVKGVELNISKTTNILTTVTDVIWMQTLTYLPRNEFERFARVSALAREYVQKTRHINTPYNALIKKIDILTDVIEKIENEMKNKRRRHTTGLILFPAILYVIQALYTWYTVQAFLERTALAQTVVPSYPNTNQTSTCLQVTNDSANSYDEPHVNSITFCDYLAPLADNSTQFLVNAVNFCINICNDNNVWDANLFLGLVLSGISGDGVFYIPLLIWATSLFCKYPAKPSVDNYQLRHFSTQLREMLRIGFGTENNPEPFGDWNLQRKISVVLRQLHARKDALEEAIVELIPFVRLGDEMLIEVIESDDEEEKKVSVVESGYSLWAPAKNDLTQKLLLPAESINHTP